MTPAELGEYAETLLDSLCLRHPLGYRPNIEWRDYRVTAGMAYYRQRTIGLSSRVLRTDCQLRDTLTHEYAHLLAFKRHGQRGAGHGVAWRTAMLDLGQIPKVRHDYAVKRNVTRQQVTYQCLRCGKAILRTRRLPLRRRFVHADCGGDLRLIQVERVTPEPASS